MRRFIGLIFVLSIFFIGKAIEFKKGNYLYQNPEMRRTLNQAPSFYFTESARDLNINHRHKLYTPAPSRKAYSELLPYNANVAVADINNDGFMDLFFSNAKEGERNFLYLNQDQGKNFLDVTNSWGLGREVNKIGSTVGGYFFDYDNDGFVDLYLAKAGCHSLYRNTGRSFQDVSKQTGVDQICRYSSSVAFLDYNLDGFLDVYIANSMNSGSEHMPSGRKLEILEPQRDEYGIQVFRNDILLVNEKGKAFKNITKEANINNNHLTWAAGIFDYNQDGYPDIFLANDFSTNRVLQNRGNGTFSDVTDDVLGSQFFSGNMSATIADYNNDGRQDVFVSNLTRSTWYVRMMNWLYEAEPGGKFKNVSRIKQIDRCSWAWGSNFMDVDRDGQLDLFITTGLFNSGEPSFLYKMETYYVVPTLLLLDSKGYPDTTGYQLAGNDRSCLFWQKNGEFYDVAEDVGLEEPYVGRGSAVVDLENNGTLDLVVAAHNDRPRIYVNKVKNDNSWLGLKLIGQQSNRDAFGAKVEALFSDGSIQSREIYPTNGYSAQNDPRVYFGFDQSKKIKEIAIRWPSGRKSLLKNFELNTYQVVYE